MCLSAAWLDSALAAPKISSIFNLQSSIFNLQFSIFNLQFSIFNLQSSIFNLQFSIFNFQSSIKKSPLPISFFDDAMPIGIKQFLQVADLSADVQTFVRVGHAHAVGRHLHNLRGAQDVGAAEDGVAR